ncbi:hypothetical protein [Neobacillus muris]|uniref:hypothetical protein n=1 Tax=Neobacillus muris TaxID=2941334 RepID=UPI0020416BC1|nr:hypothetical protein [Neobacillus muris]
MSNSLQDIEIDSLSDSSYLSAESIIIAKENLINDPLLKCGAFEDDEWVFFRISNSDGRIRNFNFRELNNYENRNYLPKDFKLMVKCWITDLIKKHKPGTVAGYYAAFMKFLEQSNGLDPSLIDETIKWINSTNSLKNKYKLTMISVVLNFMDYTDIFVGELFIPSLLNLRRKIKVKKKIRVLPPSKDILIFSKCLDDYYFELKSNTNTTSEMSSNEARFMPIIIWWKITTVIPIRPSEFCDLERNCIFEEKGNYYLRLPRHKYPKNHPNVIDTVRIDKKLYEVIQSYIIKTNSFGNSVTLISYNSILKTSSPFERQVMARQKINTNIFNHSELYNLLIDFYQKIVFEKYKFPIKTSNMLKPNDSRHIAIFSLVMQGISPIEIARLANHRTISMQLNYAHHTEYWIDSEVFSLLKKFKFTQKSPPIKKGLVLNKDSTIALAAHIPNDLKIKALSPPTTPYWKKPLREIGYCSDKQQRCETEDCIFCSHWRSSYEELIKKKEIIKNKIQDRKRNIDELVTFITNLHSIMLSDELSRTHPINLSKLKSAKFQIKESINEIVDLKLLEEINYE